MKQSHFYQVALIFAFIMMSLPFITNAQERNDPPEGWEVMYFNMGQAEYCSTSFDGGSDNLQIDLFKDGASLNITCDNGNPKSCDLFIGTMKLPCNANEYGELIINLKDNRVVDMLAAALAENGQTAVLKYGDQTSKFEMRNQAAKNMTKAVQWIRTNPIGMELE